jgi:aspartate/glutamate racemase
MKIIGLLGGMSWESALPLVDTMGVHVSQAVEAALNA